MENIGECEDLKALQVLQANDRSMVFKVWKSTFDVIVSDCALKSFVCIPKSN